MDNEKCVDIRDEVALFTDKIYSFLELIIALCMNDIQVKDRDTSIYILADQLKENVRKFQNDILKYPEDEKK